MQVSYMIVFVSDMKRAVSFYRDSLGLPLKFESPGWTEFETEGATLALHASKSSDPQGDDLPPGRCRPVCAFQNLTNSIGEWSQRRSPCIQEPREMFGVRVAQYADPDGLTISVGEE